MKKSNEVNRISHSSEHVAGAHSAQAPARTLYLIELDPNVSSCLAAGNLPLQMLNVNQNNTHYLIPLQDTEPLEILQYEQHEGPPVVDLKSRSNFTEEHSQETERILAEPIDAQSLSGSDGERPARKYLQVCDAVPPPRAVLSLPAGLRLLRGRVTPRAPLPPACFGPVRGVERDISCEEARELLLKAAAESKPVFLLSKGDGFRLIDVSDPEQSNWFSLLPLGCPRSANVWLSQRGRSLVGCSPRRVQPRASLRLGYDARLLAALRLPRLPDLPVRTDLRTEEDEVVKRCAECGHELQGAQPHECQVLSCHRRKRRYRCKYCSLPFSRLFTLKRHVSLHCKSKSARTSVQAEPPPADVSPPAAEPREDERASDESFQYSLEFSGPLFDPDTVPPDDSLLQHDSTPEVQVPPLDYSKKATKATLTKCPHCQMTMSSNMKQRHKRQCPQRIARGLRRHVHAQQQHAHGKDEEESSGTSYNCDQCQNTFKRRGMLVNHVWRVHGAAARVPLQRRQRLYPCGACDKLYRSAAKRDRHVRAHHPGAELLKAPVIDSGPLECEPAACGACPRQYATRAKLLQHVRTHHPLLAPPLKSRLPKQALNDTMLC